MVATKDDAESASIRQKRQFMRQFMPDMAKRTRLEAVAPSSPLKSQPLTTRRCAQEPNPSGQDDSPAASVVAAA